MNLEVHMSINDKTPKSRQNNINMIFCFDESLTSRLSGIFGITSVVRQKRVSLENECETRPLADWILNFPHQFHTITHDLGPKLEGKGRINRKNLGSRLHSGPSPLLIFLRSKDTE